MHAGYMERSSQQGMIRRGRRLAPLARYTLFCVGSYSACFAHSISPYPPAGMHVQEPRLARSAHACTHTHYQEKVHAMHRPPQCCLRSACMSVLQLSCLHTSKPEQDQAHAIVTVQGTKEDIKAHKKELQAMSGGDAKYKDQANVPQKHQDVSSLANKTQREGKH